MQKRVNGRPRAGRGDFAVAGIIMGCIAAALPALAQDPDSVTVDLGECIDLESPDERFACYEARVEAELRARGPAAGAAEPDRRADAETPAQTETRVPRPDRTTAAGAAQGFESANRDAGDIAQPRRGREAAARYGEAEEPREIVGIVSSLRETVPNSYLVTLENGQVWRQTYPKLYRLRPGQRVTIYPTRWGTSFRLAAESLSGYIQVERVR